MHHRAALLTILALIAATFTAALTPAGTADDPEIVDPAGDGDADLGFDLTKVWVEPVGAEEIAVNFEFAKTPVAEYPALNGYHMRTVLWFKPSAGLPAGKSAALAIFRYNFGTTASTGAATWDGYFAFAASADTHPPVADEVAVKAAFKDKLGTVTFPVSLLPDFVVGRDSFAELFAKIQLVSKGPLRGTTPAGGVVYPEVVNTVHETYDRAPNEGFGRDWPAAGAGPVEPGPLPPEAGARLNASLPDAITVPKGASTKANMTLQNLGSEPANVTLEVGNATAGLNVTLLPNALVLAANETATVSITVAAASNARSGYFEVAIKAGNLTLLRKVQVVVASTTATASIDPATTTAAGGNESASGEAKEAEAGGIPGFEWGLGAAALGLVMILRRRRA